MPYCNALVCCVDIHNILRCVFACLRWGPQRGLLPCLQAAVPKFMQLKLQPASGSVLPPLGAGTVTQQLHITNTMHGQKQLVMRLRISCSSGGQQLLEQTEVSNFPAGL